MSIEPNRDPKGIPTGGQFAAGKRGEGSDSIDLDAERDALGMTPIESLELDDEGVIDVSERVDSRVFAEARISYDDASQGTCVESSSQCNMAGVVDDDVLERNQHFVAQYVRGRFGGYVTQEAHPPRNPHMTITWETTVDHRDTVEEAMQAHDRYGPGAYVAALRGKGSADGFAEGLHARMRAFGIDPYREDSSTSKPMQYNWDSEDFQAAFDERNAGFMSDVPRPAPQVATVEAMKYDDEFGYGPEEAKANEQFGVRSAGLSQPQRIGSSTVYQTEDGKYVALEWPERRLPGGDVDPREAEAGRIQRGLDRAFETWSSDPQTAAAKAELSRTLIVSEGTMENPTLRPFVGPDGTEYPGDAFIVRARNADGSTRLAALTRDEVNETVNRAFAPIRVERRSAARLP